MSNFPRKQIGKFMSEVLVLGFPDAEGEVVMIAPDKPAPNGRRLFQRRAELALASQGRFAAVLPGGFRP